MSKKYKNIYPNIGQILPLQSKVSMYAMSSAESLKSKTSLFWAILDFVTDLGITMWPRSNWKKNKICIIKFTCEYSSWMKY